MKREMTDSKMYSLLEKFANDHSIAKGGNIKVSISQYVTSLAPINSEKGMRFEDTDYLHDQIQGALSLLMYLRRNKYTIKPKG